VRAVQIQGVKSDALPGFSGPGKAAQSASSKTRLWPGISGRRSWERPGAAVFPNSARWSRRTNLQLVGPPGHTDVHFSFRRTAAPSRLNSRSRPTFDLARVSRGSPSPTNEPAVTDCPDVGRAAVEADPRFKKRSYVNEDPAGPLAEGGLRRGLAREPGGRRGKGPRRKR